MVLIANRLEVARRHDRGAAKLRLIGLLVLSGSVLALSVVLWRWRHPPSLPRSDMDLAQDVEQRNRSGHESADAVIATSSGFAVAGTTNSRPAGVHKAWVLEFDGVELRPRRDAVFGAGLGVRPTYARAVTAAADGGLRVAGEVEVEHGRFRPWLLALAADGTVRWERTPGTAGINGLTALLSWNGDVLGGGVIDGAGWLVRMSEAGELLGERRLPQLERVTAMAALQGGRFAVAGISHTSTTGPGASAVLTFEADDRPGWEWRPPADQQGDLFAVAATFDGGVVATGRIRAFGSPDWGLWLVRLDAEGRLRWEHRSTEATVEAGYAIVALPDGGFVVAGDSLKGLADRDARVWCFASEGALRWRRSYGGEAQDLARGIARLGDGTLVVAGSTMSSGAGKTDLWVLRLSESGEVVAQQTFGGS